jgi:hypothetical protein
MQSTKLKLKLQTAISAIAQVIQEHAEEIDVYLRQESRYWFDEHPEVDVGDGDKTLSDIVQASAETDYFGWLEDALQEWLFDQGITEGQYCLVAGAENAREGILWDFVSAFAARTKYRDLLTSSETDCCPRMIKRKSRNPANPGCKDVV